MSLDMTSKFLDSDRFKTIGGHALTVHYLNASILSVFKVVATYRYLVRVATYSTITVTQPKGLGVLIQQKHA